MMALGFQIGAPCGAKSIPALCIPMWRAGCSTTSLRVLDRRPTEKDRRGKALATTCESSEYGYGIWCSPTVAPFNVACDSSGVQRVSAHERS